MIYIMLLQFETNIPVKISNVVHNFTQTSKARITMINPIFKRF